MLCSGRHRKGIHLKIKKEKLDIPIFREPEHTPESYRTSDNQPLKSRTWGRNIKRIGVRNGQEQSLTQKVLQYGGINAINSKVARLLQGSQALQLNRRTRTEKAPSSVRDQVADHESNAVEYYLNEVVDFDTAAVFHKRTIK